MTRQADYLEFDDELVDFAVAAYQEDGLWAAVGLPPHVAESLDAFLAAVRQQGSEGPTIGLVGLGDEYFLAARGGGPRARLSLSDAAGAADDRIAGEALARIDPEVDPETVERGPAGDQRIFADLGLSPLDLTVVCERLQVERDLSLVEAVEGIAHRIGFGDQFARAARSDDEPAGDWRDR
jgi:putative tRNA adenosine deaminase-associated protein